MFLLNYSVGYPLGNVCVHFSPASVRLSYARCKVNPWFSRNPAVSSAVMTATP